MKKNFTIAVIFTAALSYAQTGGALRDKLDSIFKLSVATRENIFVLEL